MLADQRQELRQLSGHLLDAQEDERRRLSRELHDGFQQRLAALGFELAHLTERLHSTAPEAALKTRQLGGLVSELGRDIRQVSHQLHPAVLERFGIVEALQSLATDLRHSADVDLLIETAQSMERLPMRVALALYRVAQEALQNAVHHGAAGRVEMTLEGLEASGGGAGGGPADGIR